MPSGKTHDRLTLLFLAPIAGVGYLIGGSWELTLLLAGSYLFSGLMFGPDLDIHSVQYKRWGCLRWLWLPYRKMIRHRGWLSHGPIVGTLFRLFYLGSFLLLVTVVGAGSLQLFGASVPDWRAFGKRGLDLWARHPSEAIALFVGLESGAMNHSLSDRLSGVSRRGRARRRSRRKRKG